MSPARPPQGLQLPVSVKHSATANGTGVLTAGRLLDLVHEMADSGVPPQAELSISAGKDPRDGTASWTVAASW